MGLEKNTDADLEKHLKLQYGISPTGQETFYSNSPAVQLLGFQFLS